MLRLLQGLARCGTQVWVIAFHDNLEASKGTKHMVGIAQKAKINVKVVKHLVTHSV
jgi:hypothetical protein